MPTSEDLLLCAKHLFVAAIGGGGHDEKEEAPAGGGWGAYQYQPGPLAERIGNVELNPLRSALLCRPYVGPNASLVARPPPADLLICAKDLFVAAMVTIAPCQSEPSRQFE